MEEHEFRQTYNQLMALPCVFAKALLTRRYRCHLARVLSLAEREAMGCCDGVAQQRCRTFLDLMQEKASFALQLAQPPLPHAKLLKLQGGALDALVSLHAPASDKSVAFLLQQSLNLAGNFDDLPFAVLVRHISQYKIRPKSQ
jgi:hypothetical protein